MTPTYDMTIPRSHAPAWERHLDAPASCCIRFPGTQVSADSEFLLGYRV